MIAESHDATRIIKSVCTIAKLLCSTNVARLVRPQYVHAVCASYSDCAERRKIVTLTKIISDFSHNGEVDRARKVFEQMGSRDAVSWNVMIKGYIENNRIGDARELFDEMPEKSSFSWSSMIMAYARERKTHIALKLFVVIPCKDVVSWTAIVTALAQDSRMEDAWELFKQMPERNSVSWSTIISGFQQNGFAAKSLNVFREMLLAGVQPTSHSMTSVLAASADLAMLSVSEQVYSQLLKRGFEGNVHIANSSISMFIKSGRFDNARRVFVDLGEPDTVTWNSMIMGYGQHGFGIEAIMFFHQMQKAEFLPDRISFLGVLHGCTHCGLIEEGKRYFRCMEMDYGISPGPEHYANMVDLFARAGLLGEAYEIIREMPFEPTPVFWRALLNGCRIWGNLNLGLYVADKILELEPYNSSACLMIIEIHAAAGRWKEAMEMRRHMKDRDTRKELGCSWVDIKGRNHIFTTRDATHPELDNIYLILELLSYNMTECIST
ncbi:pentatricopeptide repeat-containing protein At4g02750-like [Diospyros lotus]|uniref:pentatricopeptide repeat-containing protein At4g02750-like n=1 Tax=Diospyros lotus TaxID=55363 RepID=UPI00224FAE5C|nr:pentatricopeptide repeat-containing protein At4g02750-like [Diospyros lotus]XP_052173759.1 pentatricopeptide repeat-containing protein At4g02750-like [Diospyros lotus]